MEPSVFYPVAFVLTLPVPVCAVWSLLALRKRLKEHGPISGKRHYVHSSTLVLVVSVLFFLSALWSAVDESFQGNHVATLLAFLPVLNLGLGVGGAVAIAYLVRTLPE